VNRARVGLGLLLLVIYAARAEIAEGWGRNNIECWEV
jgi:hypothetical protein